MKWIKASERLPVVKDNQRIPVKCFGVYETILYSDGWWCWLRGDQVNDVRVKEEDWQEIEWLDESVVSETLDKREWKIEYDNNTGINDESFREWWKVTSGEIVFTCESEKDAKWLHQKLSTLPSSQVTGVEEAAKEYADSLGYQSDKEQYTTTPWTEWNIRNESFKAGWQQSLSNEEQDELWEQAASILINKEPKSDMSGEKLAELKQQYHLTLKR